MAANQATEYRKMDFHGLAEQLYRFANDNEHSRSLEYRWLSAKANEFRGLVLRLRNDDKNQEDAILIRDFRMAEINEEKAKTEDALRILEREAHALFQQTAA